MSRKNNLSIKKNLYICNMLTGLAAAGVSALGGALGSLFGGSSDVKAVREQNAGNMRLAQYQYEKNLEQWERENAYNTPAAQMERMKAAGLNPNLMYGDTSAGGISAKSPQYEAPKLAAYTGRGALGQSIGNAVGNSVAQYLSAENMDAQNKLIKTQAKAEQQKVVNMSADLLRTMAETDRTKLSNDLVRETWDTTVNLAKQNFNNSVKQGMNMDVQRSLWASQIENNQETRKLLQSKYRLTENQSALLLEQKNKVISEVALLYSKKTGQDLSNEQLSKVNKYYDQRMEATLGKIDVDTRRGQQELNNLMKYGTPVPVSGQIGSIASSAAHSITNAIFGW